MAKRILLESYTFASSTRTLYILNRFIRREQIILITNTTTNTVMYNFADNSSGSLNITVTPTTNSTFPIDTGPVIANLERTKIVWTGSLSFSGMGPTDNIAILVEETLETMRPSEALMDPIGKMRVATPQSLIDTDFEYGTQPTKWESIGLVNNRPAAFYDYTAPQSVGILGINTTNLSRTVTISLTSAQIFQTSAASSTVLNSAIITVATTVGISVGMYVISGATGFTNYQAQVMQIISGTTLLMSTTCTSAGSSLTITFCTVSTYSPIFIQDSTYSIVNGWQIPLSVTWVAATTSYFSITLRENATATLNVYDPMKTLWFAGLFYSGAGIAVSNSSTVAFSNANPCVCTTKEAHGLSIGNGIFVTNTAGTNPPNGAWIVKTVPTANTFTFDVINTPSSIISGVPVTAPTSLTILVNAVGAAPLVVGSLINVQVNAGGTNYQVGDIVTMTGGGGNAQVKVLAVGFNNNTNVAGVVTQVAIVNPGSGYAASSSYSTAAATHNCSSLFVRSWGAAIHRAFDGGVTFTAGLPYHGNQLIRQTRRYFRYQSGKGIFFSTGSNFCNPYQVDSIVVSSNVATVTTKFPHNLYANATNGAVVKVSGADLILWPTLNGTFTVTGVGTGPLADTTFTFNVTASNGTVTSQAGVGASPTVTVQPYQWYGSQVRTGMFDMQNGFFYQYDGQTVYAVRRSSTTQLSGYVNTLYTGTQLVTGVGTRWNTELVPGDYVVIRGTSYTILSIESATSMTIYPDYRGAAIIAPSQVIISKTIDNKIPQSSWNIDTCDGKGESGFTLDVSKMQMWVMDYAWYGAGAIRWGFKNQRGEFMYAHRMAHGNAMTEAYMRSGNLPARYEVNTFWPITKLATTTLSATALSITVSDATGFPSAGYLTLTGHITTTPAAGAFPTVEYVKYSALSNNIFTIQYRGLGTAFQGITGPGALTGGGGYNNGTTGTGTGAAFDTTNAPCSVALYCPTAAATISHWGSAVIMDGRYDDDKSLVFVAGMQTTITNIAVGFTQPLISIRISPSVDSGITGILGQREIINRMQLIMRSMAILVPTTASTFLVTLRLNATVQQGAAATFPGFNSAGGSSLAQVCYHVQNNIVVGGEQIFAFYPNGAIGGVTFEDLSAVRDIGNSILGGGNTLQMNNTANNKYPDGPDTITICVTNLAAAATNSINARISWTEAQA